MVNKNNKQLQKLDFERDLSSIQRRLNDSEDSVDFARVISWMYDVYSMMEEDDERDVIVKELSTQFIEGYTVSVQLLESSMSLLSEAMRYIVLLNKAIEDDEAKQRIQSLQDDFYILCDLVGKDSKIERVVHSGIEETLWSAI